MRSRAGKIDATLVWLSLPLLLVVLAAVLAPWLAPASPTATDLSASLRAPSAEHWLGTDQLGRDQLSRLVWAAHTSMTITAVVLAIAFTVGVLLGALGAYLGGVADRAVTWLIELALSLPSMLLALAVLGIRGNTTGNLILALSLFAWAPYARVARGAVLGYRASDASAALVGLGLHPARIVVRHVVPVAARPALVFASTDIGAVVMATAGLSFLGLGVAPPTPEWGQMLVESRPYLATAWWLFLPPGLAVTLVAFSSNLVSEHLGIPPELRRWWVRTPRRRRPAPVSVDRDDDVLLRARDLTVRFATPAGTTTAVDGVGYDVRPGEIVAVVGESGSGKTTSLLGPLGLLGRAAQVEGSVTLDGTQLVGADRRTSRSVRGRQVGVVFQDPSAALNPLRTIGSMVIEALPRAVPRTHRRARVVELLRDVGLPDPEQVAGRYPHELSGGMRQRALIATALAGEPRLLVADEPTTALDVTVQAEILTLLSDLARRDGLGLLLVSHDLAVVAEIADRVLVMYGGRVVETGPVSLLDDPRHPYTRGLRDAVPMLGRAVGTRFVTIADDEPVTADGCAFAPRCPARDSVCLRGNVPLRDVRPTHLVACVRTEAVVASC
ncbi:MAG: dipeptide/oligopeptide/nickel ABC transporter permease/ATP-binding protein [Micrococcales bacterium]|nr:dipeptide/oligopeptide/nickel ABC transporter permease/ATP-binding protein [Micrococcales bacterium]